LKQARHRVSRRFLNDGARSSLPQYLQTNLSTLVAARDDCGRRAAFLGFEGSAGVGATATGLAFAFISFSFSGRGFSATGRRQHTLLCRADMGRPLA